MIDQDRRNAAAAIRNLSPRESMHLNNLILTMEGAGGVNRAIAMLAVLGLADVEANGEGETAATLKVAPKRVENTAATPKVALALPAPP